MTDPLKTSDPLISSDTSSVISSPASAGGVTPSGWQVGQTTITFGPAAVLASLSAKQAKEKGLLTSGISGLVSSISSTSVSLQSSLASRLRVQLALRGSILFRLTWKERDMPSGRQICALRGSGLRTSDSDSTGWPTPIVNDELGSQYCYGPKKADGSRAKFLKLPGAAQLTGWPTPCTPSGTKHGCGCLAREADLASWATPTTRDHKDVGDLSVSMVRKDGKTRNDTNGRIAFGLNAETGNVGQLNPAHSRWLMGFPAVWDSCGATAMQSCRRSPRRSSKRTENLDLIGDES